MTRSSTKRKRCALTIAKYVARFHDVPPSILSEDGATELILQPSVAGKRVGRSPAVRGAAGGAGRAPVGLWSNSRSGLGSP